MKRSGPPKRRKPLASGGPLKRGKPLARGKPIERGSGPARTGSLKRGKPMRQRSEKVADRADERRAVVAAALARDRGCVVRELDPAHRCMGDLVGHELLKRSQGGDPYDLSVIVIACALSNVQIEDFPAWAHALGLVARRGETVSDCWAKMAHVRRHGADLSGIRVPN